jgi:hypothetical protein
MVIHTCAPAQPVCGPEVCHARFQARRPWTSKKTSWTAGVAISGVHHGSNGSQRSASAGTTAQAENTWAKAQTRPGDQQTSRSGQCPMSRVVQASWSLSPSPANKFLSPAAFKTQPTIIWGCDRSTALQVFGGGKTCPFWKGGRACHSETLRGENKQSKSWYFPEVHEVTHQRYSYECLGEGPAMEGKIGYETPNLQSGKIHQSCMAQIGTLL